MILPLVQPCQQLVIIGFNIISALHTIPFLCSSCWLSFIFCLFLQSPLRHFSLMDKSNYHIYHSFYEQFCLFNLNWAVGLHKVYQLWSSSSKAKRPLKIKTSFKYMPYFVIKGFLNVEEWLGVVTMAVSECLWNTAGRVLRSCVSECFLDIKTPEMSPCVHEHIQFFIWTSPSSSGLRPLSSVCPRQ